jgi:alpha,alpha-trehalose phosphorylase
VFEDGGSVTATTVLRPGQKLGVIKFVAYGWSGERSLPAVRDQVQAALTAARQAGWDVMLAQQRAYLDDFWGRADVEVDGDPEVQQAALACPVPPSHTGRRLAATASAAPRRGAS